MSPAPIESVSPHRTAAQMGQEDDARSRVQAGEGDPPQTPIDDSTGEPVDPARAQEPPDGGEPRRTEPEPPVDRRSPSDIARAEMAARFKSQRIAKEGEIPFNGDINDPEMNYGRFGAQPDADPAPGPSAVGQRTDIEPEPAPVTPAPAPKTYKLKIRGLDVEMSEDEVLRRAAMTTAADTYLDEAREILDAAKGIRKNQAARAGQDPQHPEGQTAPQDDGLNPDATDQGQHPDPFEQVIEDIQFGEPKEAAKRLREVLTAESDKSADKRQQQRIVNNELAKSQKALQAFASSNPDIANDPAATAVMLENIYGIYREDLIKTGIDASKLPKDPTELANWHTFSRTRGEATPIEQVFDKAKARYQAWRGGSKASPSQQPARAAPRVDVNVDRTQRREAIPNQPTRSMAPRQDAARQAPAEPNRSSIIMGMRKSRGQVVGQ